MRQASFNCETPQLKLKNSAKFLAIKCCQRTTFGYTDQVGPRFGKSGSLEEWKWCHIMVDADIHLRPLHISIINIYKIFEPLVCCQGHMVAPLYCNTGQVGPRFGTSGSLVEWIWCHNLVVEADTYLGPLHTSMLDTYKVFEALACCLKGIWLDPYTITPAKLASDLGSKCHLLCGKDAITSLLRLISTSELFIHPC